ncbi:hypothetical protein FA95DRAFT_993043 [Auriscalpium vulgare]|uniref:Uncharacterized protein n=1 Tax=Auriscalpium vulgare TaxID=40419 RepID=A0ACB8R6D4_9AGAM|nr:hypothetical protein FA95DRAFT_993043 [Auriscalpium vulgare]
MKTPTSHSDPKLLKEFLHSLRDDPIDSCPQAEQALALLCNYLDDVPSHEPDGAQHWFCHRVDSLVVEAATFMLRLFAYDSTRVISWKQRLKTILAGCCDCVRGLQKAKLVSRETYLAAFSKNTLDNFMVNFDNWELDLVLEGLSESVKPATSQDSQPIGTLIDIPPAISFHIVSNISILRDSRVQAALVSRVPSNPIPGWPTDPPPPGLFHLVIHGNEDIRRWAKLHLNQCQVLPIAMTDFVGPYVSTFETVAHRVEITGVDPQQTEGRPDPSHHFSEDASVVWTGFASTLRLLPSEVLLPGRSTTVHLGRVIAKHLHDTCSHFMEILRCYVYVLKRLGGTIWQDEDPDYPQVVFDAIKDNPSYSLRLQALSPADEGVWFLLWYPEYIQSLKASPAFEDVLAKMVNFLCEELQHDRFQEARPAIISAATTVIRSVLKRSQIEQEPFYQTAALNSLVIHIDRFATIAFSRRYNERTWLSARAGVRTLLSVALRADIQEVANAITSLCRALIKQPPPSLKLPNVHPQLWKKTYDSIEADDIEATSMIIHAFAQCAHLNLLTKSAFQFLFSSPPKGVEASLAKAVFNQVNESLSVFRTGFADAVSSCANRCSSHAILELFRQKGIAGKNMVQDVIALMLCPVEDIQAAVQSLVGQAFDVDVRSDCFRALLDNVPGLSLHAITDFISTFTQYVSLVPEACDLSKSLVRCLTDIIEVLCSHPGGLLHDETFLRRDKELDLGSELPRLWRLMAQAISAIFRRTPEWSKFFSPEDMVQWMRDALIFGRDMLAQWRVFAAISGPVSKAEQSRSSGTSLKFSGAGENMVDDLQQVLPDLARWLRLTDEELLHQSFALLQTLLECFRDTHIKPAPAGLAKLNKIVDDARNKDPKRSRSSTRLDTTRLAKLEDVLASFEESDDEIEIVSHTVAPKTAPKKPQYTATSSARISQKSAPPAVKPSRPSGSASHFTAQDQKRLDSDESLPPRPKFDRSAASTSRATLPQPHTAPENKKQNVPQRSSMSEDSSADESSHEGGLANLTKFQRTPKLNKPVERRMQLLELPVAAKNALQNRLNRRDDARRIALRMKPDISNLHRAILSWSYDATGSQPPWDAKKMSTTHVPDRFKDFEHYRRVFEPLLLLECWAQLLQSKDETKDAYECKIASRMSNDEWVDLDISITDPLKQGWFLAETDVVLLRHPNTNQSCLAKALSFKATRFGQQTVQALVRCHFGSQRDPGLEIGSIWRISKVFSLSTLHREYAALVAMPHYDFANFILNPRLPDPANQSAQEIQKAMTAYNVNDPQARAIVGSLQTEGFSLIQGPPGTGKTSTICGLVQAFLSSRPRPTTTVSVGRAINAEKPVPKKILLCAPSNAAIDEVAYRLKEGASGAGRKAAIPKVVRVGADKALNISVRDISLDSLVDQRMDTLQDAASTRKDTDSDLSLLRSELDSIRRLKQEKQTEQTEVHDNSARSLALEAEVRQLNQRRMTITQQLDKLKDKQKSDNRTLDAARRKIRQDILSEADVICCTLSGAGHDTLERLDFEMIIIDEAAQAIELSSLIPLKFRCARCILVGDPQQLPPTVISQEANKYQYNQSLFVRFQKLRPDVVHLLSIQYRMHPDISQVPSRLFYQGRLEDGHGMAEKTARPWHSSVKFGTYRFFNVVRGQESTGPFRSLLNQAEVQVALALYARLRQEFTSFDFDSRVGVVSMYRAQIVELKKAFERRFGAEILSKLDFNTVDGFQGQEKDIIILSCVRAGPGLQSVGFLSDIRRMNVALTRAKSSLFVLGHCPTLERSDETWKQIVVDARARSCLVEADVSYFTSSAASNAEPPPPPSRPTKPEALPTPVVPKDLIAARDVKSTKSFLTKRDNSLLSPFAGSPSGEPSMTQQSNGGAVGMQGSLKRSLDSVEPKPDTAVLSAGAPRPRPPPAKKQKQGGASLFIPKKRPPPDSDSAGPSNRRRT